MRKHTQRCLAVAAVVIAVFLTFTAVSLATVPNKFLFTRYSSTYGAPNIYTVSPGGGTGEDLTKDGSSDNQPKYSPAANKIVFESNRGGGFRIYKMNPDGSSVEEVTNDYLAQFPTWSPDGTKIAFTTGSPAHLHVINANGSGDHQVGDGIYVGNPAWSPDGTEIAYSSYSGQSDYIEKISASASSGEGGTALTSVESYSCGFSTCFTDDESPAWSPDGSAIAFSSNRDYYRNFDVYTMESSNGSNQGDLTNETGPTISDQDPIWAPGGGVVYYLQHDGYHATYSIRAMTNGGGAKTILNEGTSSGSTQFETLAWQQEALPTVPSSGARYVALGDSVAAGEGINYDWEWTPPGEGETYGSWSGGLTSPTWKPDPYSEDNEHCHQSLSAYPTLVRVHLGISTEHLWDYACTGASTENGVLGYQRFEDSSETSEPQLGFSGEGFGPPNTDYDSDKPDLVTLTLGADDVHFSDFLKGCYGIFSVAALECDKGTAPTELAGYLAAQAGELEDVLTEIRDRGIADGRVPLVAITTYYDPFPAVYSSSCPDLAPFSAFGAGSNISEGEVAWVREGLRKLNENIVSVSSQFANVVVVPLDNLVSGHGFCSNEPWVYGPSLDFELLPYPQSNNNPAAFHPDEEGQQQIADRIEAAIG